MAGVLAAGRRSGVGLGLACSMNLDGFFVNLDGFCTLYVCCLSYYGQKFLRKNR